MQPKMISHTLHKTSPPPLVMTVTLVGNVTLVGDAASDQAPSRKPIPFHSPLHTASSAASQIPDHEPLFPLVQSPLSLSLPYLIEPHPVSRFQTFSMSSAMSSSTTLPVDDDDDRITPVVSITPPARAFIPSSNSSSTHTLVISEASTEHQQDTSRITKPQDDEQDIAVPDKKGSRPYRYLRWNFGSVYRRIFTLAFLGNMAALLFLIVRSLTRSSSSSSSSARLTPETCATAVSANILAALFIRNEHTVNAMFALFVLFPPARTPLPVRRLFAKVYSYGGVHSGCGVAAFFWFLAFLVVLTGEQQQQRHQQTPVTATRAYVLLDSYLLCALLALIIGFAHPRARVALHNWFECTHRFLGWTVVLLFWALVMLLAGEASTARGVPYAAAVAASPSFWMLAAITLLVAYPWTRLRLRDVEAEVLSAHVVKLNFSHADVRYGQAVRLADAPLRETHAFAVIPNPAAAASVREEDAERGLTGLSNAGKRGFSVLVSNAGDWTARMVRNPPRRIWTRGVTQYGVLRVAGLFEPCVVVATGSGIGPCLSLFVQKPDHPVRIVWSAQRPVETYGRAVLDTIYRADPDAVVIDTDKAGRPDLVAVAWRIWERSRRRPSSVLSQVEGAGNRKTGPCEAVVVISNQKVTRKVVYGLESRGVAAYGAIFDS
ncbi:Adenylate-forming reductase [Colletotrichum orbiculare MAFF 240422]|uniref:Adenylate-forming reductase n=1 Tax=Colletotrichum orbiculare (strain 104-T / ATCC 96160 / CBS 514.97 / LARS 414 / MAFF 240422) TaxID=1213857 RepID=A0A484GAH6_COLOR|nr:Adenylate-forming reductase [Colletotrichum orbiculare MAFF 240422]